MYNFNNQTLTSTLEFVDLAGSERISVTGSQGV